MDLQGCGLYPGSLRPCFPVLAAFVTRATLTPYDVPARTGELKNLLVTQSPDGELMLRFVLRSQEPVARIRKHLPWLLDALPQLRVVSVNLLPDHKAVLEGEREILLTTSRDPADARQRDRPAPAPAELLPDEHRGRGRAVPARGVLGGGARADAACGTCTAASAGSRCTWPRPAARSSASRRASRRSRARRLRAADLGLAGVRFDAGDATEFALARRRARTW